jgi:hypothetical protein
MGFCAPEQTGRFLGLALQVEKAMADEGIVLLKYGELANGDSPSAGEACTPGRAEA